MNQLEGRVVLVSGASRGIGRHLVEVVLEQGADKVYACARQLTAVSDFDNDKVVPLALDIVNPEQIQAVVNQATDVQILINNAGVNSGKRFFELDIAAIQKDMDVNYYGNLAMIKAFQPIISNNGGGDIVNVISICGLAAMPGIGPYSASKAALFSSTQALRTELKQQNINVYGVFPGPVDTDMNEGLEIEMASPRSVADNIIQGFLGNHPDIFPDPIAEQVRDLWLKSPKSLEVDFSQYFNYFIIH